MRQQNDPPMKASTIEWHLARDNQAKLSIFCERHRVSSSVKLHTHRDEERNTDAFEMTSVFDNGGFITAELLHGNAERGFGTADHYQVLDYAFGS